MQSALYIKVHVGQPKAKKFHPLFPLAFRQYISLYGGFLRMNLEVPQQMRFSAPSLTVNFVKAGH